MVKVGIIGYGYWGPNLLRNFYAAGNCQVLSVADGRDERLALVRRVYPAVKTVKSADEILSDVQVDAVVIATPVSSHYELAKKALMNGKHVLVEKPMTASVDEAEELILLANARGLTLMVDHTFLYTGAVVKMKELIDNGSLGVMKYLDSTRINLGLFQHDINVLWDLAPHDISILNFLVAERPLSVNATGITHTNNDLENIAYLTLNYNSGFIAHFNCSWTSPVKIRMMLLGGDKKMVVYNDLEPTEKIKIYDTGYEYKTDEEKNRVLIDYRSGDMYAPKLQVSEALSSMANDFLQSILNKTKPLSDYSIGYDVVKILQASSKSLKENGKEIFID
jgi:predicted dehydrogenase